MVNILRNWLVVVFLFTVLINYPLISIVRAQAEYWSSEESLPINLASNNIFYYSGNIYTIAGSSTFVTEKNYRSEVDTNGSLSEWQEQTPYPKAIFWYSSVLDGSRIYVFGGTEYPSGAVRSTASVYRTDIATNSIQGWVSTNNLPQPVARSASTKIAEVIYVSGGGIWTGGSPNVQSSIFSTSILPSGDLGAWISAGSLPGPMMAHQMFYTGSKLYLIGGFRQDKSINDGGVHLAEFAPDGSITGWVEQPTLALPIPTSSFMMTRVGDYLILAGGRGPIWNSANMYDGIYFSKINLDGTLNPWQESQIKLPKPLALAGITTNGQKIYITGGHNTSGYFKEVWSIETSHVISGPPTPTPPTTPTPTPIPLSPLVFVPGMGASWNHDAIVENSPVPNGGWSMAPYAKDAYEGILLALQSAGYETGKTLFVYNYDWRKDVRFNAEALRDYINTNVLSGKPADTQADLVGHSMGGLISRIAAGGDFADKINRVITLGSPHNGTALAYLGWEGAEISGFTGLTRVAIQTALGVAASGYQSPVSFIQTQIPSVQNLLPGWDYLKTTTGVLRPNDKLIWQNNVLEDLITQKPAVKEKLGTIGGQGHDTIKYLTTDKQTQRDIAMGRWVDGRPIQQEYADGDGTILNQSAIVTDAWKSDLIGGTDHGELCSESAGQLKLLQYLGVTGDSFITYPKSFHKAVVVTLGSPAVFSLVLPNDEHVYPEGGIIALDNPAPGRYQLKLTSTRSGVANIYFGRIFGSDAAWSNSKVSFTSAGQNRSYFFDVDFSNSDLGSKPVEEIKNILQSIKYKDHYPPILPFINSIERLIDELDKKPKKDVENIGVHIIRTAEQAIILSTKFNLHDQETVKLLRQIQILIDQHVSDVFAE